MAKRWEKAIALSLAVGLMLSAAGCGTASEEGDATSKSDAPAGQENAEVNTDPLGKYEEPITLTTVRILESDVIFDETDPRYKSLTENVWADLYKEKLNITFDYLWTPTTEEYNTKWNAAIATKDIPDCASVDAATYKELLEAGLVEDMTDYFETYACDTYKEYNEQDEGMTLSYMTFDGRLYGLPLTGSQPDNVNLLMIRRDWLKAVGKEVPTTMEELIDVAQAFVDAKLGGEDTTGLCISKNIGAGQNNIAGFLNGFGAYYDIWLKDEATDSLVYSSIQPEMRDALLKLQEMYQKGLIRQDFSVKDEVAAGEDLVAGKVGMTFGTFWAPVSILRDAIIADETSDWIVVCPPTVDGSPYRSQASAAPGNYIFVKKGTAHPEAVVKIMNLGVLTDDEATYGQDIEKGIEVYKYAFASGLMSAPWKNLVVHQKVTEALATGDTTGFNDEQLLTYDLILAAKEGDRTAIGTDLVFGENSTYALIEEWKNNDQIVIDENRTLPTDTWSTSGTTLKAFLDAAMLKVIMGDDISTFDNAVEAWKNGGGDKITDEINEWYKSN